MRVTCRLFLATVLLIGAAGVASAQDAKAAPPPSAPEPVAAPVAVLPPIPVVQSLPAVEPALPADQDSAPAVEPAAPLAAIPSAPEKLTTTKPVQTKKAIKKSVEKPVSQESESIKAAGAAASTAAVDTTGNTPPGGVVASAAAPPIRIAPPPPAVEAAAVESHSKTTKSQREMGIGGWVLAALTLMCVFGIMTLIRRRRMRSSTSIVDRATIYPELQPSLVQRP